MLNFEIINFMQVKILILLTFLLLTSESIFIGLKKHATRCMIEFIVGSGHINTVKMKISFPELENEVSGEHFYLSLRNTQTNKTSQQPMRPGSKYVKEQQFEQNVIYEICITFRTQREIEAVIEYETQSAYNYKHDEVKVPETLLTKNDFKEAFVAATYLKDTIDEYNQQHKSRKGVEYRQFGVTEQINRRLIVLVGASLYQFFSLKNYLSTKQYI